MDPEKKPSISSTISIKYSVNEDEIKNIIVSDTGGKLDSVSSVDDPIKTKKNDRSGSIINKYFKSFKSDKNAPDDGLKSDDTIPKDNIEKSSSEASNISGSPIKEYFNKFNKRAESIDASSDTESIKDSNVNNDRWKIFNEFRFKIAQAVEDIKSSKNSEGGDITKDKTSSVENASPTDSEENSLHLEFDASTENQVSSLTNSTPNLSELSPPIISHSNTMTDMDIETSSLETNKNLIDDIERVKSLQYDDTDDENDEKLEVESGVDALEDAELVTENKNIYDPQKFYIPSTDRKPPILHLNVEPTENPKFFSFSFMFITLIFMTVKISLPGYDTCHGFIYGVYFCYFVRHAYLKLSHYLKNGSKQNEKSFSYHNNTSYSKVPHIVEFEPIKKYDGWINVYMFGKYDPLSYHISLTQTAFMKLEGHTLRLSFTHNKIPKHALWDEQSHKVPFHQHRIYDLTGAKIKLLPIGIVKKRHWSKKYPICIILKDKSKMTVYNAKSDTVDENNQNSENQNVSISKEDNLVQKKQKQTQKNNSASENVKNSPRRSLDFYDDKLDKMSSDPSGKELFLDTSDKTYSKIIGQDLLSLKTSDSLNQKDRSIHDKLHDDVIMLKEAANSIHSETSNSIHNSDDELNNEAEINKSSSDDDNIKITSGTEWTKDDVTEEGQEQISLYLFGRTGRDKEEWFRRLKTAVDSVSEIEMNESILDEYDDSSKNFESDDNDDLLKLLTPQKDNSESRVRMGSVKSEKKMPGGCETPSVLWTSTNSVKPTPLADSFRPKQDADFWKYMRDIIEFKKIELPKEEIESKSNILWLNALLGRVIFDTFKNNYWVKLVQERIQKKLTSLKLPNFMGPLIVTALEFGPDAPQFQNVSAPTLDNEGVWIDLQLFYNGRATMTLTTQLNLMKLKEKKDNLTSTPKSEKKLEDNNDENLHAVYHSDLDDTAESSSEDEAILAQSLPPKISTDADNLPAPAATGNSSAKKILRLVDKIAANKYFQHVTDYKYVKRAMEGVSNTDLKLSVELYGLYGCLTINIPPPPSDRIWFGFRGNPQLFLKAKPVVGSHTINIAHITSWIENKLCTEFEKLLVLPNMEDFQFDCMIAPNIE